MDLHTGNFRGNFGECEQNEVAKKHQAHVECLPAKNKKKDPRN